MKKRPLQGMNWLLFGLAMISCMISILNNDIYQDGAWANAQWLGQDMVTLFLALPLLLISFNQGVIKDKWKWKWVYAGILFYFVYTYTFFVFVAKLTFLYLFHLPIFGLAVSSFVWVFTRQIREEKAYSLKPDWVSKAIIGYLFLIALMLAFLWLSDIFAHLTVPGHRSETPNGEAPLIIYSLDLGIVLPLMILSAWKLLRKQALGFILTGVMLTKTSTLGFALMAMALSMYFQNLNPELFLAVLWCIIGLIGTSLTILFFVHLDSIPTPNDLLSCSIKVDKVTS
jgi:hypothetical protein